MKQTTCYPMDKMLIEKVSLPELQHKIYTNIWITGNCRYFYDYNILQL